MKKIALSFILALASLAAGYALITPASAGPHEDACLWNYNQCMKGCDGATSCSNQCKTNYDNCMR